jgi:proteasome lid subunit RPN8/RPN11
MRKITMFEVNVIENAPAYRPRPTNLSAYHRYSNEEIDIFVHKNKVLKKIATWARQRSHEEIVGRLVGRPYQDDRGVWSVVTGAILSRYEGGPSTVRTTVEDSAEITRSLKEDYPSEELMGWYHSHICPLDRYSQTDKINQAEWRKPYHVGLLVVVRSEFVTIHAFLGPKGERLAESYIHRTPKPPIQSDTQTPALASLPSSTSHSDARQVPSFKNWIELAVYLILWPMVFLLGIQLLADGVAQIHLPAVPPQVDDLKPIAEKVNHTANVVENLKTTVDQQMSRTEQQFQEIQANHNRNQNGMSMLNCIAKHLSFGNSKPASEIDLDDQGDLLKYRTDEKKSVKSLDTSIDNACPVLGFTYLEE